jgi:hypothetical protein
MPVEMKAVLEVFCVLMDTFVQKAIVPVERP